MQPRARATQSEIATQSEVAKCNRYVAILKTTNYSEVQVLGEVISKGQRGGSTQALKELFVKASETATPKMMSMPKDYTWITADWKAKDSEDDV